MKLTTTQLRNIIRESVKAELGSKKNLNEAMSRITAEEVEAWKKGDWGYVAGDEPVQDHDMMDMAAPSMEDPERFLHGKEPHDDEGSMVKSRLYSMKDMAKDICDIINPADQLPGWVQDHISVAHENLQQVHGYLMGQQHAAEHGMMESKKTLSEAHTRVTQEEMNAWMRGDWGFVSEAAEESSHDELYLSPGQRAADYEECSVCGFDHGYEPAAALAAHKELGKPMKD